MLYYLLYASYANSVFTEEQLRELLTTSIANNKKFDITGMLLHIDGKFIQLLEGPENNVLELYKNIKADGRHNKVAVILEGPAQERLFPDWKMALKVLDKAEFEQLSGYTDIEAFFTQDAIDNQSHPAKIFLRLFYQKNYRDFADLSN
ncbi:MAG: BLUF domain-containing protein [Cyclobacteriaceae bacterium]